MLRSVDRRWIALIRSCSREGRHRDAVHLFLRLLRRRSHLNRNPYMLPTILRSCASLSDLKSGRSLHAFIIRSELALDAFISAATIHMYSKCRRPELARRLFDEIPERDLVVWNSMISGYSNLGLTVEAMALFEKMQDFGQVPDLLTWNSLVSGFSHAGDYKAVSYLFSRMRLAGLLPDVISWTAFISGLVHNFRCYEALGVLRKMVMEGITPNSVTISSVLPACATVADLRHGREIHAFSLVTGIGGDMHVSSSLLDMYAKCGLISEAEKVFNKMSKRSTITLNSMIFGYANHGRCAHAIELFRKMVEEGIRPDHLTFTGLLNACSIEGMIEVGKGFYNKMQQVYGIEPRSEHYGCVVDLLGRAGRLREAHDLIMKMSTEPDSFVWGALLGACQKHGGDIKLAEIAALKLRELEPRDSGGCLGMKNVLVDAGRLREAMRLKILMRKKKLKRLLGCSWMQSGHLQTFF